MRSSNEKGTDMIHRGRAWRPFACSFAVMMSLIPCILAKPAFASNSTRFGSQLVAPFVGELPQIKGELSAEKIFATRALIEIAAETHDIETKWRTEYATQSEFATQAEFEASPAGSGITVGTGNFAPTSAVSFVSIGLPDATSVLATGSENDRYLVLHHLSPATSYYARFTLENVNGKTSLIVAFKTLQSGAPEIARDQNSPSGFPEYRETSHTATTCEFKAQIEGNGLTTEYHFEYSQSETGSWAPISSGATGIISAAEDFADLEPELTGLMPGTTYFIRLRADNQKGEIEAIRSCKTHTDLPVAYPPVFRNEKATSVELNAQVEPNGSETYWRFEVAASASGPWAPVAGAEGTVTQSQAESLPEGHATQVEASLTGLAPATIYYVRVFAESSVGEGVNGFEEPILSEKVGFSSVETEGPPTVSTLAVHALHEESIRLLGTVNPNSVLTREEQTVMIGGAPTGGAFTLTFDGHTTPPIAFDAPSEGPGSVEQALSSLPGAPKVNVNGLPGGPYTVVFVDSSDEPQIVADESGLTPSGTVAVSTRQDGGESSEAKYWFEYVTQKQYEDSGFKDAAKTLEEPAAPGNTPEFVGQDVPGLETDQSYSYRLVATSTFPGNPVVQGAVHTVSVPVSPVKGEPTACPNAQLRTGSMANLPDCRAYEQLTPVDKQGAQEPYNYGPKVVSGASVGEDGNHLVFQDSVLNWGTGPNAGQSPYLFSREDDAWGMVAGSPQPETGVQRIVPELFSDDTTRVAFEADVYTSLGKGQSKEVQLKAGPVGGPYTLVASVPRKAVESAGGAYYEGWVASSGDFSKLLFQVEDHRLLDPDHSTGTTSGDDVYEYSVADGLRQTNVGVGSCGAHVVTGHEHYGVRSSSNAVSSDGSRVFFEAVPGNNCSAESHLYMRKDGSETVNIGAYRFSGANPQGTKLLVERENGGGTEYAIYDTENATTKQISISGVPLKTANGQDTVSQELKAVYFYVHTESVETVELYRYDVESGVLSYLFQEAREEGNEGSTSPDGRFFYFKGTVAGVPGEAQVFLYDNSNESVECVSCASSTNPEPKLGAYFPEHASGELGPADQIDGHPNLTVLSKDGNFAFFDTPAALVPSDVDGEITPTFSAGTENQSQEYSPSSDVYEWRRAGVDGCTNLDGCLALITNGRGGFLNLLLGSTPSGNDVFIYTNSELLPPDNDTAGDIYDARVNGGFAPPPPGPVECEASACSNPPGSPNDATPSSSTSTGNGNVAQPAPNKTTAKSKKHRPKKKVKKKRAKKHVKTHGHAKKSSKRSK
jgi:hypothetical protein